MCDRKPAATPIDAEQRTRKDVDNVSTTYGGMLQTCKCQSDVWKRIVKHIRITIEVKCTEVCKFVGKDLRENAPAARESDEVGITQFLTRKYTHLSNSSQ